MTSFDPNIPYNDLPMLPPPTEVETKPVLKKCIDARAALAELKTAGRLIPNQSVLINIIPLLEAKDSSAIENIVTTTDKLFKYSNQRGKLLDAATKETLQYRTALKRGCELLQEKPLSANLAIAVCSIIKNKPMNIRRVPGTALANEREGQIIYTPPNGEQVIKNLLSNWEKYLHNHQDVDPLIRMAIGHYQFEAIHPFLDGNGRTGRILNILFLMQESLLNTPTLYLSRYITNNKRAYYRLLLEVTTQQSWQGWVLYILEAVIDTSRWTVAKIEAIKNLSDEVSALIKLRAPKIYSRELVDLIFTQPYCRIQNIVEAGLAQRQAGSTHLRKLCELGILEEIKEGREKLFLNPSMLELLTQQES